jgi:hypothetical protein
MLKGAIECPVEFGLFGEGPRELRLDGSALAAREVAAPQLGPYPDSQAPSEIIPPIWGPQRCRLRRAERRAGIQLKPPHSLLSNLQHGGRNVMIRPSAVPNDSWITNG